MRRTPRIVAVGFAVIAGHAGAVTRTHEWKFDVSADGIPIGTHDYIVAEDGSRRTVESHMHFSVKLLAVNAYQYEHRATEVWQDDCLASLETKTEERGSATAVTGHREADAFAIDGADGHANLPACVMTFAYWNPRVLSQSHLVNVQTGTWTPVSVEKMPEEVITVHGHALDAKHYRLRTPKNRIDLWYSSAGEWLAMRTTTNGGHTLAYQLR